MTEIEIYALHAPACLYYINACWSDSMSLAWMRMRLSRHAPCLFCQGFSQFTFQTRVCPQTELWAILRKYRSANLSSTPHPPR